MLDYLKLKQEMEVKKHTKNIVSLILFMAIFSSSIIVAQDCPDADQTYNLKSQADVDEFLATHPNCTYLGELEISGDIHDIDGFLTLKSVDYLYIGDCPNLNTLGGFSNIDSIFENLGFYDTEGIQNLCGLESLTFIGNDLRLEGTVSIRNLEGLEGVKRIVDRITIEENQGLESLNGIQNVEIVEGGYIAITDNPLLSNCCGLQEIISTAAGFDIRIENNPFMCSSILEIIDADCDFPVSECLVNTKEIESIDIKVFPNPASNNLRIENKEVRKIDRLLFYNSLGQAIHQVTEPSQSVPIDFLSNGLYIVELIIGDARKIEKIIVQNN